MKESLSDAMLRVMAFVCVATLALSAFAQTSSVESDVKAAFLLNFPKFVDWPSSALGKTPAFTICLADDTLMTSLKALTRNETVGGKPLRVEKRAGDLAGCQVFFISGQAPQALLSTVSGMPILTVGEDPAFLRNGGMIRFTTVSNRVRFEINPAAAEKVGLRISSRLLRLAEVVEKGPER